MTGKLDIGGVFNRIFEYYTRQASIYLPAALILFLPAALITGAIVSGSASLFLLLLSIAVGLITAFLYQGVIVESVRDLQDGRRDQSLGSLFASVPPVLGSLVALGILGGLMEAIGFLLLIVPGCILITIWAVAAPVVVVERKSTLEAFGRSQQLVRGNGWQVFGVLVILFLLQIVVGRIVAGIGGSSFIVAAVLQLIVSVLVAPLGALAAGVMYFELLSRHETGGASAGAPGVAVPFAGAPETPTTPPARTSPPLPPPPPPAAPPPPTAPLSSTPVQLLMDELERDFAQGEDRLPAAVASRGEQLGLRVSRHTRGKLFELADVIDTGGAVIAFVDSGKLSQSQLRRNWFPIQVLAIEGRNMRVTDPSTGTREISQRNFEQAWKSGEWLVVMNLLSMAGAGKDPTKSWAAQPRMWLELR